MKSEDLRIFLAVAREKRVKKAARNLNLNQTTINRRINALEDDLALSLFSVSNGEYSLTDDGERVFEHAVRIEEELFAIDTISSDEALKGHITVTLADITYEMIAPELNKYHTLSPELTMDVVVDNWNIDIVGRQADIAIRATQAPPKSLYQRYLGPVELALFSSAVWGDTSESGLPLVGLTDDYSAIPMARWLVTDERTLLQKVNSPAALVQAVRSGIGASVIPVSIGRRYEDLVQRSDVLSELTLDAWFLAHPSMMRYQRFRVFETLMVEAFS